MTSVPTRPFGALGESVPAFGLGLGPLTRAGEDAPWSATVGAALESGVTLFDAAPRDARPRSETLLGQALVDRRDDCFLSTRCSPLDGKPFDTSADAVRAEIEASLARLQTDRIDLYQVHDVEAASPRKLVEVTLPALVEARERGEVRYIGASGGALDVLCELATTFPIDAVLSYARYDLIDASLADELLPVATERGIAVINASPLHMGLLADRATLSRAESVDDPVAHPTRRAFEIAERAGTELPRLALAFAAAEPGIATTLVGCRSEEELREDVAAFTRAPSEAEAAAIEEIRGAFSVE